MKGDEGDEGRSLEVWGNDGELKEFEAVSESLGILSEVRDD